MKAIATETYILPVVANVEYTTTYNSITLTPSGTDGTKYNRSLFICNR